MANQLAHSTSRYLRQHADNPVPWHPWGEEAFAEARQRNVPILLSIGYSACHWCHVMAHESFEDPQIGALVAEHLVAIKVDREEHPDVDHVYMQTLMALTGQGGWPLTAFLTPEGAPFQAGTYYPPRPHPQLLSFSQLVTAIAEAWRDRESEVRGAAERITAAVAQGLAPTARRDVEPDLDATVAQVRSALDPVHGGFGTGAKFPASMVVRFLLDRAGSPQAPGEEREHAQRVAAGELAVMADSGLYDPIGGGFYRYCTDRAWTVPHFEKMLYDNALLLDAYAVHARATADPRALSVTRATADFLLRELTLPAGGLASSLDADSPAPGGDTDVEGGHYLWSRELLRDALTGLDDVDPDAVAGLLHITAETELSPESGTPRILHEEALADTARWERVRTTLLAARDARPGPGVDDKVVLEWNGLAIVALVSAADTLEDPELRSAAERLLDHLETVHATADGWMRTSHDGAPGTVPAMIGDIAALGLARRALGRDASELLDLIDSTYAVPGQAPGDAPVTAAGPHLNLFGRTVESTDNAVPAGLNLAALLQAVAGRADRARELLAYTAAVAAEAPQFAGEHLRARHAIAEEP